MRLPVLALVVFTADLEFIIVSIVFILFWLMVRGAGYGVRGSRGAGYGVRGSRGTGYAVRGPRYGVRVRTRISHLAPLITSHLTSCFPILSNVFYVIVQFRSQAIVLIVQLLALFFKTGV